MKNKVKILGVTYKIIKDKYQDDEEMYKNAVGYCAKNSRELHYVDPKTIPGNKLNDSGVENLIKETLRHEVLHAFFYESGLGDSSLAFSGAWALNEEMVDFFAMQMPKLIAIYKELEII